MKNGLRDFNESEDIARRIRYLEIEIDLKNKLLAELRKTSAINKYVNQVSASYNQVQTRQAYIASNTDTILPVGRK